MPSTTVITGEWARGHEIELIEGVQSAFLTALKTPEWNRDIVVALYDDGRRIFPQGKSERFTRIEITLFTGRSMEAKRNLHRSIVDNLAVLGIAKNEIKIVLIEVPPHNWGIQGGLPASEVDIGFKIDV